MPIESQCSLKVSPVIYSTHSINGYILARIYKIDSSAHSQSCLGVPLYPLISPGYSAQAS